MPNPKKNLNLSTTLLLAKGNKWYEFRGPRLQRQGPLSDLGLPAATTRIDAAVIWEGNGRPYFFVGNDYYRFNEGSGQIDAGYPRPITPNWKNIPGNVDATFGAGGKKTNFSDICGSLILSIKHIKWSQLGAFCP